MVSLEYVSRIFGSAPWRHQYVQICTKYNTNKTPHPHRQIPDQKRTNEFVVEPLELIAQIVIARFANNIFNASHQMINETLVNALVHGGLLLVRPLHVEELNQRLDCDSLNEYREIDHGNGCRHEHRLQRHMILVDQQHQSECDGTAQSAIRHNELIDHGQLVQPKLVRHGGQDGNAYRTEYRTEHYRQHHKPGVPVVPVVDGRHAQEHEYDRFGRAGHHFQGVLYGCVGFLRDVRLHIVFHGDAAECDATVGRTNYFTKTRTCLKISHSRQNTAHVEKLSIQIGQVGHNENEDRLDNTHVISVSRDKTSKKTPYYT